MKKAVALVIFVLLFGNANASLSPDSYNLPTSGSWNEIFNVNPGVAGAFLSGSGAGWSIAATSTANADGSSKPYLGTYDYMTPYNVLFEVTAPGAWGEGFILRNVPAVNYSTSGGLDLKFTFIVSGAAYNLAGNQFLGNVVLTAVFDSFDGDGIYSLNGTIGHGGTTFESLTLQVVPIPAAALLLGTGLVGLVVMRRSKRG